MSIISLLVKTYWKPLAIAIVLLGVAASIGWYGHAQYAAGFQARDVQAQQEAAQILAQSRAKEQAAQTQMEQVRNDALKQKQVADAAINSARTESERLRDAIARERTKLKAARATAGVDADASRAWELFDQCRVRYESVARDADEYVERLRVGKGWAGVISGPK